MDYLHISIWDEVDDFLTSTPTPQQIIDFTLSDLHQQRLTELLQRHAEGNSSSAESDEIQRFLEMDAFLARLKARAMKKAR